MSKLPAIIETALKPYIQYLKQGSFAKSLESGNPDKIYAFRWLLVYRVVMDYYRYYSKVMQLFSKNEKDKDAFDKFHDIIFEAWIKMERENGPLPQKVLNEVKCVENFFEKLSAICHQAIQKQDPILAFTLLYAQFHIFDEIIGRRGDSVRALEGWGPVDDIKNRLEYHSIYLSPKELTAYEDAAIDSAKIQVKAYDYITYGNEMDTNYFLLL